MALICASPTDRGGKVPAIANRGTPVERKCGTNGNHGERPPNWSHSSDPEKGVMGAGSHGSAVTEPQRRRPRPTSGVRHQAGRVSTSAPGSRSLDQGVGRGEELRFRKRFGVDSVLDDSRRRAGQMLGESLTQWLCSVGVAVPMCEIATVPAPSRAAAMDPGRRGILRSSLALVMTFNMVYVPKPAAVRGRRGRSSWRVRPALRIRRRLLRGSSRRQAERCHLEYRPPPPKGT